MNSYSLIRVTSKEPKLQAVLKNLTKMYCFEWSQYTGMDVDERGEYSFEHYLPSYWEAPDRKAFLLRCEQDGQEPKWAGFALIDRDFILNSDFDFSLAEFFVLIKYRRQGAGKWMAFTLFDLFPGKWEVGRSPKNRTAYDFWEQLISDYTGGRFELVCASPAHRYADGTLGDVFSFDSKTRKA